MNEPMSIWMEDENGQEIEFEVVGTFEVDGHYYMALFRVGNPNTNEADLIGIHAGENDEVVFDPITDDALYQRVAAAFMETFNDPDETEEAPEPAPAQEEDDFCYEDEDGRLFVFGDNGEKVFLDENGQPII